MMIRHLAEATVEILLAAGLVCWAATLFCAVIFRLRTKPGPAKPFAVWPAVSLLKPVCGLEKNLAANLRTACEQDYPEYQVVYSVQRSDDPAIPLLREIQDEFGTDRVTVAVESAEVGCNGKINNLVGALRHARHDVLVISDSDVRLRPDYLKAIVAPLADPGVGAVSTFYRATDADSWYEQMERLTLNADYMAIVVLADVTKIFKFIFGASMALRREMLAQIGGLEALGDYLVEDYETGQRVLRAGMRIAVPRYVVETMVDLRSPSHWWQKQTYWDQNVRATQPLAFAASIILRVIPLSLVLAALRGFDRTGLVVLAGATMLRLAAAAAVVGLALGDRGSLRALWMIPIKDILALWWFVRSFTKRTVVWRGVEMVLKRDGRLAPLRKEPAQ